MSAANPLDSDQIVDGSVDYSHLGMVATDVSLNEASKVPSVQAVKSYVDTQVAELDAVVIDVENASGSLISKGAAVYISGETAGGVPQISLASTSTSSAVGLVQDDIANGAAGFVVVAGDLKDFDTSGFSIGDKLYLNSVAGNLTATRPSSGSVQNIGFVARDHASNGIITVVGAGRSNDIDNETIALLGTSHGDSDLGVFSGTVISDNTDIVTALQELETELDTSMKRAEFLAQTFTADETKSFTHNMGSKYVHVTVFDDADDSIVTTAIVGTSSTQASVTIGAAGTYSVLISG